MATTSPMTSDTGKLSFAEVAASASKKEVTMAHPTPRAPCPPISISGVSPSKTATASSEESSLPVLLPATAGKPACESVKARKKTSKKELASISSPASYIEITADLEALRVTELKRPDLFLNGGATSSVEKPAKPVYSNGSIQSQPSSDDVSQQADSSSEFGTKPPSLDGKSITSGTTFNALDEKESLRPDDSASVKAAADEDDSFSVRGSLVVNSRLGSDTAPRIHRIQIGDMPPRIIAHTNTESATPGIVAHRSLSSEQQPITEARVQLATSAVPPDTLNGQSPDEKLLDAMQTAKDRLFLLRLESDVVNFVQNSKEPFMDLPPSNSFCRMLTHKLADYYHMTHSFEAVAGSVRIFRTPFCRVPPPLASLVTVTPPSSSTPPPVIQPKKIMRRGEDTELSLSTGPSKPNSETGSDSKDKGAPAKETLSREAREEAYNKARERIFGSSMPTESSTPENDDGTGISRASSVSAKDKTAMNKKLKAGKQRRDDSESFDSRSQYTPYYTHPQHPTWIPPQYILPAANGQFSPAQAAMQQLQPALPQQQVQQLPAQLQTPHYPNTIQPQVAYGSSPSGYIQPAPSNGLASQVAASPQQYPPQPVPSRYPTQSAPPVFPYAPASQATMAAQRWQQLPPPPPQPAPPPAFSPNQYPSPQTRTVPPHVGIPYAFGQLPVNVDPNDPKSQHPIPGSYAGNYNRHAFNPQTQSFVPGNGAMPVPSPPMHYSGGMHGPIAGLPPSQGMGPSAYGRNGFQQPAPSVSPYGESPVASYGMLQQGSNNSGPPYSQAPVQTPLAYQGAGTSPHGAMSHGPAPGPASHGPRNQAPVRGPGIGPFQMPPRGPSHGSAHSHKTYAQIVPAYGPKKTGAAVQGPATGIQPFSYLPNYGNPATLPQKPATTAEVRQ